MAIFFVITVNLQRTLCCCQEFFLDNSDAMLNLWKFLKENLEGISVETVQDHILEKIPPNIASSLLDLDKGKGKQVQGISINTILKHYGMKTISHSTVYRWMRALGMKYSDRKKNFYVGGHERHDVLISSWAFVRKHLKLELQVHRWIQKISSFRNKVWNSTSC